MLTKIHIVKVTVFPVVMYGCESLTIKKAACQRIDAFQLWCWRRLLRVPWTARRSNQSILEEINPEYSFKGLMLKLMLQCFGHLMQRANSLDKTLLVGKIENRRRRGWQRMRWLYGITDSERFPGSGGKQSTYSAGDLHLIPGLGRSSGEENDNPLQYCWLENPIDRRAWWAIVHGVAKSWTWLTD